MRKDGVLDTDIAVAKPPIVQGVENVGNPPLARVVTRAISQLLRHFLVREERPEARDERQVIKGGARTTLGVIARLLAVRAFVEISVRANKAATGFLAAVIFDWFHAGEKCDLCLKLVERGEITKLRACTLSLLVRPSPKVNIDLQVVSTDCIHSFLGQAAIYRS
jgi:hypothetical protein